MRLEDIDTWIEELKKRGITKFENKDLPEELRCRTMIIKAKYAGVIKKVNKSRDSTKWEIT